MTEAEDNLKIRLDEFDKIDSKVNNNKSRLDILIGSIEQRGRQLSQIKSDITSANTLAKSAEEELENLQAKVKIERGTLGNLQTQVATKGVEVARLDQTKSDLEQEIEKLKSGQESVQNELQKIKKERDDLRREVEQLQSQRDQLFRQNETVEQEREAKSTPLAPPIDPGADAEGSNENAKTGTE